MFAARTTFGVSVMIGFALLVGPLARAQDDEEKKKDLEKDALKTLLQKAEEEYRVFFRRPEKVHEFWAAIKFEVEVGKFDLAGLHLKQMLAKEPPADTDKELVGIAEVEGLSSFLRLQNIRKWSDFQPFQEEAAKNVQALIDRVTAAMEKHLGDPERITKFIKRLDAPTPEERAYAFAQLKRARDRAAPYLIEQLRLNVGKPLHDRIVDAAVKLDSDIVPPLLEVLKAASPKDAQDPDLRSTVLQIIRKRADKRAVPYLWHISNSDLSSSLKYPAEVRDLARNMLAAFLQTGVDKLPLAKVMLTDMAERYYRHEVRFPPGKTIRVWEWNGKKLLPPRSVTPRVFEEYYGLRYAREALDLDPAYEPAQMVYLSFMLERRYDLNLDQALLKPMPPNLHNLFATVDPELLTKVLERALTDNKPAVILPTVQALGERGEARAAKLGVGGVPRGLVRALYYPDRRVQYAAVKALLRLPGAPPPVTSVRMVDVLRRFLAAGDSPKALAAYVPPGKANEVRQAIKDAGFEPVLVKDVREAFERLREAADYELIFLFPQMADREWPYVISQFRSDDSNGRLPILVFAPKGDAEALTRQVERSRGAKVYPETWLGMTDELKAAIAEQQREMASGLTPEERKEFGRVALDTLWRMARGEVQGYDLRPAQEAVTRAARNPDYATEALEILGRLPGQEPQARLAGVVLDAASKFRVPAAMELNRSIQKYGLLLGKQQVGELKTAYDTEGDAALKSQLALVMGSMRTSAQATGQRLFEFRSDVPPPPEKKEKGKEKEKEKDAN